MGPSGGAPLFAPFATYVVFTCFLLLLKADAESLVYSRSIQVVARAFQRGGHFQHPDGLSSAQIKLTQALSFEAAKGMRNFQARLFIHFATVMLLHAGIDVCTMPFGDRRAAGI